MKIRLFTRLYLYLVLGVLLFGSSAMAASPSPALLEAKSKAEAKGYIFFTSHEEIVARARKEGRLRVLSSLPTEAHEAMTRAFKKKYPFIDVYFEELGSVEGAQRFLLEVKAGLAKGWDVNRIYTEFYDQYLAHQKKFDILGMAEHKVLGMFPQMVDPNNRHVVAPSSNVHVVAYNRRLISEDKVPSHWEEFLKPEFKGRKFAAEIRPVGVAALVPAWGIEKTVDFSRKIAAQQPIWGRGHTSLIASVLAGELSMFMGTNFSAVKRAQVKDPEQKLGYKFLEPVSGRLHLTEGVLGTAEHPHAGLLWLEFEASAEGQDILDKHWPFGASVLFPASAQGSQIKGKKLSLIDWSHYTRLDEYTAKVVEAYGFPKVEKGR